MSALLRRPLLLFVGLLLLVDSVVARPVSRRGSMSRSGSASFSWSRSRGFSARSSFTRPFSLRSFSVRTFGRSVGLRSTPFSHGSHLPLFDRSFRSSARLHGFPMVANPFVGRLAHETAALDRRLAHDTAALDRTLAHRFLSTPATGPRLLVSPLGVISNPYLGGPPNLVEQSAGGYSADGYGSAVPPLAAALHGYADLTRATGSYWEDIGKARQDRETANQMMIDTEHKRIEFERWEEATKDTAPKMRDRELSTDLDRARKDPPATEVWSARPLNDLLKSIQANGKFDRVEGALLDKDVLAHTRVTDGRERGSIGMFKAGGNLDWPEALKEFAFDKARLRLARNLRIAIDQLKHNEPLEEATLRDVKSDFKALIKVLDNNTEELGPAQYIEAKRFLNQLSEGIRALSDPKVINHFNGKWVARGRDVTDLVARMTKEGLVFAPATPGDESAYNTLYLALRNYEAALNSSRDLSTKGR
jgi:hypothetical protein